MKSDVSEGGGVEGVIRTCVRLRGSGGLGLFSGCESEFKRRSSG